MSTTKPLIVRGRIKEGTIINQDFRTFNWPECMPTLAHYKGSDKMFENRALDVNMIFNCKMHPRVWDCSAPGFGDKMDYGNGSLLVRGIDSIELVDDQNLSIAIEDLALSNVYTVQINTKPLTYVLQIAHNTEALVATYITVNGKLLPFETVPDTILAAAKTMLHNGPIDTVHVNMLNGTAVTIYRSIDGYWVYYPAMENPIRINANHYTKVAETPEPNSLKGCSAIMYEIVKSTWGKDYVMYL